MRDKRQCEENLKRPYLLCFVDIINSRDKLLKLPRIPWETLIYCISKVTGLIEIHCTTFPWADILTAHKEITTLAEMENIVNSVALTKTRTTCMFNPGSVSSSSLSESRPGVQINHRCLVLKLFSRQRKTFVTSLLSYSSSFTSCISLQPVNAPCSRRSPSVRPVTLQLSTICFTQCS